MAKLIIQSVLYLFGLDDNPFPVRRRKSDAENLASDWENVGRDIQSAIYKYEQQ